MSWSDAYIGIPFVEFGRDRSGCDCWGLACVVYLEVLGITLPSYLGYTSADEHHEIAALIDGAVQSPLWVPVEQPEAFDVAVFRRGRWSTHIGVVLWPGVMLHMAAEDQSKVQGYIEGPYKHRLVGFYRHHSRAVEGGAE